MFEKSVILLLGVGHSFATIDRQNETGGNTIAAKEG